MARRPAKKLAAVGATCVLVVMLTSAFAFATTGGTVNLNREGASFTGRYVFYPAGINRGGFGYPGKICDTEADGDSAYVEAQDEGYDWGGRVETTKGHGSCVSENMYVYAPDEVYVEQGRIHACVDISFWPDPCKTSSVYSR